MFKHTAIKIKPPYHRELTHLHEEHLPRPMVVQICPYRPNKQEIRAKTVNCEIIDETQLRSTID